MGSAATAEADSRVPVAHVQQREPGIHRPVENDQGGHDVAATAHGPRMEVVVPNTAPTWRGFIPFHDGFSCFASIGREPCIRSSRMISTCTISTSGRTFAGSTSFSLIQDCAEVQYFPLETLRFRVRREQGATGRTLRISLPPRDHDSGGGPRWRIPGLGGP